VKIDPNLGVPEGQSPARVGSSSTAPASKAGQPSASKNDQASLSDDAVKFSNLSAALTNVPDVRQDRVSAISQSLANGSYSVSDQQIAQAMVRDYQTNSAAGG